jgi:hypothetical protein
VEVKDCRSPGQQSQIPDLASQPPPQKKQSLSLVQPQVPPLAGMQKLLQQSEFLVQGSKWPLHGLHLLAGAGGGLHVPFLQHTN